MDTAPPPPPPPPPPLPPQQPPPPPPQFPSPQPVAPAPQAPLPPQNYATAPKPPRKGLSCWAWGCIIAGILGVVGLVTTLVCCGGPAVLFQRTFGGLEGAMAMGWVQSISQGDMASAGQLTIGGETRAIELRDALEAQLGKLQDASDLVASQGIKTEKDPTGAIIARVPGKGERGTGTIVVKMRQSAQTMWQVEDATVEVSP